MTEYMVGRLIISLRDCRQDDLEFTYDLTRRNMAGYFDRYTAEGWSRDKFMVGFDPSRIKIAEHEGRSVGFYDVEFTDRFGDMCAYVHNVELESDYRGRWIGQFLLRRIGNEAMRKGAKKLHAKVFIANERTYRWLLLNGWERVSDKDLESREHSFVVEKLL